MLSVGNICHGFGNLRRVDTTKAYRGRPRKHAPAAVGPGPRGTLTRTKSLLLAALRVWELKHRISD